RPGQFGEVADGGVPAGGVRVDAGPGGDVLRDFLPVRPEDGPRPLAVVGGVGFVEVNLAAAERHAVLYLPQLGAGNPQGAGPWVGLPRVGGFALVECVLDDAEAAVDPGPAAADNGCGPVEVHVAGGELGGLDVPVGGEVDRQAGHAEAVHRGVSGLRVS